MSIKTPYLILAAAFLCACASAPDIKGSWIDNSFNQRRKQGV